MTRSYKDSLAERFGQLDFHDDGLKSVRIRPPRDRNNFTRIDFELQDDSTGRLKTLSFRSCANFRFVMDFDVVADNWPFNTRAVAAKTDLSMRKFVETQKSHWRTTYMPPMPKDKPIRKKLRSIRSYILFRVAFFGGTAEILAKNYGVSSSR
jgi:hypothetical protein